MVDTMKESDTPETDSRTQTVEDYLRDVRSSGKNQPCKTVVPSTFAQKLERRIKVLEAKIAVSNDYT